MYSLKRYRGRIFLSSVLFIVFAISCGGGPGSDPPSSSEANPVNQDICNCTPTEDSSQDYRHDAKHVGLPGATGTDITVGDILGWPQGSAPAADAPRSGRETQMFFIKHAYAQNVNIVAVDCDVHVEISDTPDKTAPRVIVETPVDGEYCDSRRALKDALAQVNVTVSTDSGELNNPVPVSVLGLAFQDFEHTRGSQFVQTTWELHPAIVTVLQQ